MLGDLWDRVKGWWAKLTQSEVRYAGAGVGIVAAGVALGGIMLTATVGALIINAVFWMMILESQTLVNLMRKFGYAADVLITVGSVVMGGGGVTAWFTATLIGAFFSIFRNLLIPKKETVEDNGIIDVEFVEVGNA